jgi:nuclear pore complex protein Nup133
VALGENTVLGKEIWALVDTRLQKWNVTVEGWEDILMDDELSDIIRPSIRDAFPSASADDSALDLELLDLAIEM